MGQRNCQSIWSAGRISHCEPTTDQSPQLHATYGLAGVAAMTAPLLVAWQPALARADEPESPGERAEEAARPRTRCPDCNRCPHCRGPGHHVLLQRPGRRRHHGSQSRWPGGTADNVGPAQSRQCQLHSGGSHGGDLHANLLRGLLKIPNAAADPVQTFYFLRQL